jgi:hypothetical protein
MSLNSINRLKCKQQLLGIKNDRNLPTGTSFSPEDTLDCGNYGRFLAEQSDRFNSRRSNLFTVSPNLDVYPGTK